MIERLLVVSDLHAPYMHPDTVPFLTELKKKYKPARVVLTGDEVDKHSLNFHGKDPDLPSSGDELEMAIEALSPIYKLFPAADVLESNHGSLAYRRAFAAGMSKKYLREYRDVLRAPKKWRWHMEMLLSLSGYDVYFMHGLSSNVSLAIRQRGLCVVQGHFHTKFEIVYVANPRNLLWGLTVGCLIDDNALAYNYNKLQLQRPVIGCGLIENGLPKLLPMQLDAGGRWSGVVP